MDIGPIWRAMLKNKAGFVLIALQIAVTMTIMVNAVGIMQERAGKIGRPSGMDEANTFALSSTLFIEYEDDERKALIDEDLELIRAIPGVKSVVATNCPEHRTRTRRIESHHIAGLQRFGSQERFGNIEGNVRTQRSANA